MAATWKRSDHRAFDSPASLRFIERLGRVFCSEHPQVDGARPAMREEMAGRRREQPSADPEPRELVTDVEIVQQGAPSRISVANGMGEAE